MTKNKYKIQNSEFEEKLRESRLLYEKNSTASAEQREEKPAQAEDDSKTIPVVEEKVKIGKKTEESGSIHVIKHVTEEELTLDVPTIREELKVERVPVNQYVDTPPPALRHEGQTMIVPVLREESVIVKRLLVVEELHITKHKIETHDQQQVTLKKEAVSIEPKANKKPNQT